MTVQMDTANTTSLIMNASDISDHVITLVNAASEQFHKIPGSAIFLRYVQSSYQNDPVRSAVELFLVLFAIRYLLAPKYSTKPNYVKLSEEVLHVPFYATLRSQSLCWVYADDVSSGNRRSGGRVAT